MKVFAVILAIFVGSSMQASTPTSPTYIAGVVEFSYEKSKDVDRTSSNLQNYLSIMSTAPANLDIIVFPEMTFNAMSDAVEIPEVSEKISPCDSDRYPAGNSMKQISCSAKAFQRYVVVNMVTKAKCPDPEMLANKDPRNCSARDDGFSYYNTNVVFDRKGTLISRYRKFNLFGEQVDKPLKPAMVTFETDFGVTFGHFICFDIAFRYPAVDLVRSFNVTDVIFPTMWFSEAPFLTAVQVQQNWAYTNDVNLLAAGANFPDVGSSGSGIYARKKGSLKSVMEGANRTTLYFASVPKKGLGNNIEVIEEATKYSKEQMATLYLKTDVFDRYTVEFLPDHQTTPDTSIGSKLCNNDICCNFHYSFKVNRTKPSYYYALAVYHGNRTFDGFADGGVLACAVLACHTKDNSTSCGERNDALEFAHEWYSLDISGSFPHGDDYLYMPTSLDTSIMPYSVREFAYEQRTVKWSNATVENIEYSISMKSVGKIRNFYAFGIYGRDFSLDAVSEPGAAGIVKSMKVLVVLMTVALTIFNLQ